MVIFESENKITGRLGQMMSDLPVISLLCSCCFDIKVFISRGNVVLFDIFPRLMDVFWYYSCF